MLEATFKKISPQSSNIPRAKVLKAIERTLPIYSVLDLGCGDRSILDKIPAFHVVGVDIDEKAKFDVLRDYQRDDLSDLGSFDLVLASEALYGMTGEQIDPLMRLVNVDGYFLCDHLAWPERWKQKITEWPDYPGAYIKKKAFWEISYWEMYPWGRFVKELVLMKRLR